MNDPFEQAVLTVQEQRQAKRLHGLRAGFRVHASVFVFIQLLLVGIWAATGANFPWPLFVFFGWGAGLAAHGMALRSAASAPA